MKIFYAAFLITFISISGFSQMALEWEFTVGTPGSDFSNSIDNTLDGGFIIGGNDSNITAFKINSDGIIQWKKNFQGTGTIYSIKATPDGGYIFTGDYFSGGSMDLWIVKLDGYGNILWQKFYGGTDGDRGRDIILTHDGGYAIAGSSISDDGDVTNPIWDWDFWILKVDSVGNLEWQKSLGGNAQDDAYAIIQAPDGGFLVAGETYSWDVDVSFNHGGTNYTSDCWLVKLDSLGNLQWEKTYGGTYDDYVNNILQTSDGGFIFGSLPSANSIISCTLGGGNFWIVKTDSLGNVQWQECYGGTNGYEEPHEIKETNYGTFIIGGSAGSTNGDISVNYGWDDYWIIEIDNSGNLIWEKSFGGSNSDILRSFAFDDDGGIVMVGTSMSNDVMVSVNYGLHDIWVVKITPDFNSISGYIFVDLNSNSSYDPGEPFLKNHTVNEISTGRFSVSNQQGEYDINVVTSGSFSVTPANLTNYLAVSATHSAIFAGINEKDSSNTFAFQPVGVVNDLKVTISPVGPFRPGFDANYNIKVKNIGTTSIGGTIVFYPDSGLSYVSASVVPASITPDSIVWNVNSITPFDESDIMVTVNISAGLVIGTTVTSNAMIDNAADANPADNTASWTVTVQGSYDPNDILVNRDDIDILDLSTSPELEYLIRFQNTGTDTAFTVKIKNYLPKNVLLNKFQFVESSHPVDIEFILNDTTMWFNFENILLPDSNTNELMSHGYVRYKIKAPSTLMVGDLIENTAAIFFDFNEPVVTNTAVTEIIQVISVTELQSQFEFHIFPNPVTDNLNIPLIINSSANMNAGIYNVMGSLTGSVVKKQLSEGKNNISISTDQIPPGIYFLKVEIDGVEATKKFIKF